MKSDGKVVISTELDNSGFEKGIKTISGQLGGLKSVANNVGSSIKIAFSDLSAGSKDMEALARTAASAVEGIGDKAKAALQKQVDAFAKQNSLYAQQRQKVDELQQKLSELSRQEVETEAFKTASAEAAQLEQKMNALIDRQERFIATGGNTNSRTFRQMDYDLEQIIQKLKEAEAEKQKLNQSGGAYQKADTSGVDQRLAAEYEKLRLMHSGLVTSFDALSAKIAEYGNQAGTGAERTGNLRNEISRLSGGVASTAKGMHAVSSEVGSMSKNLNSGAKTILKYGIGVSSLRALLNKLSSAVKEGAANLVKFDGSANKSVSALTGSLKQLKNSLATAFSSVLNAVAPALTTMINLLSNAASYVSMFMSALTGKGTYTKAIAAQEDYAASLESTGGAAKDAKKQLAGFDEITKLDSNDSGGAGGSATGDMLVTEEVPSGIMNLAGKVKAALKPILQDFEDFGKRISNATKNWFADLDFSNLETSFSDLLNSIEPFISAVLGGLAWAYETVLLPLATWTIEDALPAFLGVLSGVFAILNSAIETLKPLGIWLWDNFLQPIAEWTGGVIVDALQWLGDALVQISDWIAENSTLVESLAIAVGIFTAALLLVNGAVAIWNGIAAIATAVTTAFGAAVAFLTSPIGIAVIAVAALIAVIALLVKNWDTVKDVASNVWEKIKEVWTVVSGWFDENVIQPVAGFFTDLWDSISSVASDCWEGIKEFFAPAVAWFSELLGSISQTFSDIFYNIGVLASGCWEIIKAVWEAVSGWFDENVIQPVAGFFEETWENVTTWASDAWEGIQEVFSDVAGFFGDIFSEAWEKVVSVFSVAGEIFTDIKDGILMAFKEIVNGIIRGLNSAIEVPFNGINSALRKIRDINILGLKPFSGLRTISVPRIPELAKGAVLPANKPFLAMVGDQKHGTNVEAPLETIQEAVAAVMDDYASSNLAGQEAIVGVLREILEAVLGVQIGDDVIGQACDRYRRKMAVVNGGLA